MKTWIVSSLGKETIQGGETNQGRKLYEEIRYVLLQEQSARSQLHYDCFEESDQVDYLKIRDYWVLHTKNMQNDK